MRTPDDIYDEWLIIRCQNGDAAALGELVQRFQPRLLRHAARLMGGADKAADVVQEAWLAIIRGMNRLDDPARFRRWAYQIVTHKCADAIRSLQRQRAQTSRLAADPPEPSPPTNNAEEEVTALREAMRQLPSEVRAVLAMYYLDELSVREIAQSLALPEGTVKSRLYYARRELQQLLERNQR